MAAIPIACQLYTLRTALSEDYPGTLHKVRELGYEWAQISGVAPPSGNDARRLFEEARLQIAGMHMGLDSFRKDIDGVIEYCRQAGIHDVVLPWVSEEERKAPADWLRLIDEMEQIGAHCRRHGLRFSYHNHSFEFMLIDGRPVLDLIYERTSPDHVCAEIDTYWIQHGGGDPVEYIERYAGRCPLLHVKDMGSDGQSFESVGSGILDWPAIHAAAQKSGVEFYIVEQDVCPRDPLACVKESLEFLRQLQSQQPAGTGS